MVGLVGLMSLRFKEKGESMRRNKSRIISVESPSYYPNLVELMRKIFTLILFIYLIFSFFLKKRESSNCFLFLCHS